MGVSRRLRCKWREQIPTRFALTSKATSPFQGGEIVARMKRSAIRGRLLRGWTFPDYAALHPGYLSL
ncbi:hypothetical protein ACVIYL_002068 [Bradyrhizobium sp. USDA 3315]